MGTFSADQWRELFTGCRHSASHLEMRDIYAVEGEEEQVAVFQATGSLDLAEKAQHDPERSWFLDLVRGCKARGVRLRRARIISEPVTSYIRYEYAGTPQNILAGEEVRWLPRTKAARLALPGADFWLFDQDVVVFNHFTGDGDWLGNELIADAEAAKMCSGAFEAVWALATPHDHYQPA